MDEHLIGELSILMKRHSIAELDIEEGNLSIHLAANGGEIAAVSNGAPEPEHPTVTISAPVIGRLVLQHPFSEGHVGFPRLVEKGEIVAWLKAGIVLRPVLSPARGILQTPLRSEGDLIGYGDALF